MGWVTRWQRRCSSTAWKRRAAATASSNLIDYVGWRLREKSMGRIVEKELLGCGKKDKRFGLVMENFLMNGSVENQNKNCGGVNASLQQYHGKPFTKLCTDDLVGKWFETLEVTSKFYYDYAHAIGFSMRKDALRRGKDIEVSIRQWCCSCQGFRPDDDANCPKRVRTARKETRTGCKAVFLVNYCTKNKRYVVRNFITDHNHELVPSADSHFLRSRRNCNNSDVAQATVL
ncbi:hypothetical protein M0R45_031071 [Rubus argutus]|uniref:FAR1 domain-containing protein n=1 Tax=Rubus argutus TaxID=59490 RepID=A0AAW1WCU5_RUBAR